MIELFAHAEGVILRVKAQPGARKNGVVGEHGGALKVAVTAPPDRGRANQAIVTLLAEFLKVGKHQVTLLSGEGSRDKRFVIRGVNLESVQLQLTASLTESCHSHRV